MPQTAQKHTSALDSFAPAQLDSDFVSSRRIVGADSVDKRSRPFNLLRTQLLKRLAGRRRSLVGVTSASPGAGKSFISLNLAFSLSRVVKGSTLLVDLDLRRGSIAKQLGLECERGISDYLAGATEDLCSVGQRVDGTALGILPTRSTGLDTAHLVAGDRFEYMINQIRDMDDEGLVLFDLPPVFATDDAPLILRALDGYIMVVDSGTTTRRQLKDALAMLSPAPLLGTILNRYSTGVTDIYGYGSGAYDSYYGATGES